MRNRILVYTASLLLGVLIYALSWNMMFKVGSVNLENESLAGIKLMQLADKKALEKKFGEFKYCVDDGKGKIGFGFNNSMHFLSVEVDSNNQVTAISVANSPHIGNIELITSKNIGPGSSLYDVLNAYGNNCYMESERDPMGDGWDYVIYVDRENNIILEFDFSVFGGIPDSQEGLVESIVLKKGWSGARN